MNENQIYSKCQSCAMPIKKEANKGTEVDQSLSNKYCKYCYKDGAFIEPNIKLAEFQEKVAQNFKTSRPIRYMWYGKIYIKSLSKLERWNEENS